MAVNKTIAELVHDTHFIDTHEHLVEESTRMGCDWSWLFNCNDFTLLFGAYTHHDFLAAGMSGEDWERVAGREADLGEKFRLFKPWWDKIKHTGYGLCDLLTIQRLYGEEDITRENYQRINQKFLELAKPGFYREVLCDIAKVKACHVNALTDIFRISEQPDLLYQDISILDMANLPDVKRMSEKSGVEAGDLKGYKAVIDWYFEAYGRRAIAVKSQAAYLRRLDFVDVSEEDAAPIFARYLKGEEFPASDLKALQDHLMRYCITKSTEYSLPVKLHTGYYAGVGHMPLSRVRQNPSDVCQLLMDFPDTRFVFMHIGYPYQEEMIAVAKHHDKAYIDMCWSWIINPVASVRFVKDYLMAAPHNKLFTFGGDVMQVEKVVGHAEIARRGITEALSELVEEGWLFEKAALEMVPALMHGNAEEVFNHAGALEAARETREPAAAL